MRVLFVVLFLIVSSGSSSAADDFETASIWWKTLPEDERYWVQSDLVLTGWYDGFVDGEFGPTTYKALQGYERSIGERPDGRLNDDAVAQLSEAGTKVFDQLGMELMILEPEGVGVYVPREVLSEQTREPEGGSTFSTPDRSFSLYATGWNYTEAKLASLSDELVRPTAQRSVSYQSRRSSYAVASGRQDGATYYSMVAVDGDRIVGIEVVWADSHEDIGRITATFAASYSGAKSSFDTSVDEPVEEEEPDTTLRRTADAAREAQMRTSPLESPAAPSVPSDEVADLPGQQIGPFYIPTNAPTLILLTGEILPGATLEFRRALRAQPGVTTLMLGSPGGSVNEGLLVAHLAAEKKLATHVPAGAACYSACAYIFFAGSPRTVEGELGVHQIYGKGVDASDTQVVLSDVLEALHDFGVPQEVVSTMLRTRPDEMYVFSPRELEKLSINRSADVVAHKGTQPAIDVGF